MIAVIDYGMGNIHSVQKALEVLGAKAAIVTNPAKLKGCKKIVLPGVGAFDDAMLELKKLGLADALKEELSEKGKAFLGICLGMQLLFEKSDEAGKSKGLGILKGRVRRFKQKTGLKVPHIGWNQLKLGSKRQSLKASEECHLLRGLPDNAYAYFCHSYYPEPKDKDEIAATCDYGVDFACVLRKDNIYGTQFHPEKSQAVGLRILKNFIELC